MDGQQIERRRRELGLSAEQLGELAGVSRPSVRNLERGVDGVTDLTAQRIVLALEAAEAARAASASSDGSGRTDLAKRVAALEDLMRQVRAEVVAIAQARGVVLPERQRELPATPAPLAPTPRPAARGRRPRG